MAGADVSNEVKNVLKEVDRNGDGRIDYEEFCDMMRQVGNLAHGMTVLMLLVNCCYQLPSI